MRPIEPARDRVVVHCPDVNDHARHCRANRAAPGAAPGPRAWSRAARDLLSTWCEAERSCPGFGVMATPGDRQHRVVTSDGRARLFVREIGAGEVIVVVHGGPDFDQSYLCPEL